jgi:hypothetical protein
MKSHYWPVHSQHDQATVFLGGHCNSQKFTVPMTSVIGILTCFLKFGGARSAQLLRQPAVELAVWLVWGNGR